MKKVFEKIREKLEYTRVNCTPRINGEDCTVEELNVYNMAFTYAKKLVDDVEVEFATDTNMDRIRRMSEEELAAVLMCPYDSFGNLFDEIPCYDGSKLVTKEECRKCCVNWLKSEAKE